MMLGGDDLAISDYQAKEHQLKFLFEMTDIAGNGRLKAYQTDPKSKCRSNSLASQCEDVIY